MTSLVRIEDSNDARLEPYRHLKDRDLAQSGDRFIAESEQVVRRLIASNVEIDSILLAERRLAKMAAVLPSSVSTYVVSDATVERVIGFRFHSGVIACGIRPKGLSLDQVLNPSRSHATVMFLPDTNNTENLGLLMRIAAAFGVDALILGPRSCDPFYRQAVRVSMGTVFALNVVRADDTLGMIQRLKEASFQTIATTLDPAAEPLATASRAARCALLFGNESSGLASDVSASCDRRVTIPMELGTDSLNVAIAAGIVMHHFTRVTRASIKP